MNTKQYAIYSAQSKNFKKFLDSKGQEGYFVAESLNYMPGDRVRPKGKQTPHYFVASVRRPTPSGSSGAYLLVNDNNEFVITSNVEVWR